MDDCEKFNGTLLPEKEDFYNHIYGRYYWWRLHAPKNSL